MPATTAPRRHPRSRVPRRSAATLPARDKDKLPAAVYVRISDDREGRELGVQRQEQDCRALAERTGLSVGHVFAENDTGASTRSRKPRPQYKAMIEAVERGEFGFVLAYSNSRLTRRPMELEGLIKLHERTGVKLVTVVSGNDDLSTADGRMVARIKASVDAAEAERTGERVARAARQRAEQGRFHGGTNPPFGYSLVPREGGGNTLALHPVNAAQLREAATRVLNGESLYGIITDWNDRGLRTSRGAIWRAKTLRNALLSAAAIGHRSTVGPDGNEELHEAEWPPVLDRTTWDRLHEVLTDPARTWQPRSGSYAAKLALGGGLTVCDLCGKPLVSQRHRGHSRLICHKQATGGCGVTTINYAHLEEFVMRLVWEVLDTPEVRAGLGRPPGETTEDTELRLRLQDIERQMDRAFDAFTTGIVDRDRYLRTKAGLEEQADALERRLTDVTSGLLLGAVPSLDAARERWDRGDIPWRRAFISALIREVRVKRHPEGVASTLTRYTKRGETDEEYAERVAAHRAAIQRQRVVIEWRS